MRFVSTVALSVALALGSATVIGAPAFAQKKEEKQAAPKLSKPVRDALQAAQTALKGGDLATAQAKVNEAKAAAQTEDERFYTGSIAYDIASKQSNQAAQGEAIEMMLASGRVPADNVPKFYMAAGQIAYQNKDMAKAEQRLTQAIQTGSAPSDAYALLVETKNQQGKPAEALTTLQEAIAKQKAAGQTVPNEWYARGISIGYQAKLGPQLETLTQSWLQAYPSPSNWRDSLITYRDLNKVDPDYELDLMRLMRAANALKGERDYMDYVQATYLKFPTEANGVLDEGVAKGDVKLTANANEIKTLVKGKLATDKTETQKAVTELKGGKGTGRLALGTADALYGAGDYAQAAEIYRIALQKGGVDANLVNSRLGAALARAGQKDAAKQAFSAVTGPRQGLARYWTVWMDQQAG